MKVSLYICLPFRLSTQTSLREKEEVVSSLQEKLREKTQMAQTAEQELKKVREPLVLSDKQGTVHTVYLQCLPVCVEVCICCVPVCVCSHMWQNAYVCMCGSVHTYVCTYICVWCTYIRSVAVCVAVCMRQHVR